jgi:geranylgeranyl transferase type-2 subunit alpha
MVAQLKQAQADLTEEPGQQQRLKQQVAELYTRLMEVDPLRKGFYEDAAAGRAAVVVRGVGQQDVLVAEAAVA